MNPHRIVIYNHQEGGVDGGAGELRYDRLAAQLEELAQLEADVIFSTEAKRWLINDSRGCSGS